ncbi:hypothetical protein FRX31_027733 [Thalictrum thalictroides]|uniref:Uncharacterized protein n=1 Tax=Thalictrum thalictroides TaxID=46969 RepID=A0A7J6VC57_THATH|nr:hypothetical protein FRX31_027733 [Thalictrum thalictroides]
MLKPLPYYNNHDKPTDSPYEPIFYDRSAYAILPAQSVSAVALSCLGLPIDRLGGVGALSSR